MNWRTGLFILICGLVLFWPLLNRHVAGDVGVYSYVGSCVSHGLVPYKDAWDIKSPGIFIQYGVALLMLGHSDAAVVITDFLLALGAALMIYVCATKVKSETAGMFAAIAWLITYNYMHLEGWFGQPETGAALLAAILFYLGLEEEPLVGGQCFLSGFVVGLLMWYKLPFILFAILLLPRMGRSFARNRFWDAISPGFMGFMAAVLPVVIYYLATDSGKDLWEGFIVAPYLVTTTFTYGLRDQLRTLIESFMHLALWTIPVLCFALLSITGMPRDKKGAERLTWGWLLLAGVVVVIQQRYLMYYWILVLPPLAILAGVGADKLFNWMEPLTKVEWIRTASIVAVMAVVNVPRASGYWQAYFDGYDKKDRMATLAHYPTSFGTGKDKVMAASLVVLGDQLRQLTQVHDTILSFDMDPAINFYADRRQPTRFSYLWPLRTESFDRFGWRTEFSKDIMRGKPKFIVICRENRAPALDPDGIVAMKKFPTLFTWFRANYDLYVKTGALEVYADHATLKKSNLNLAGKLARLERLR